jgi:hypothetical protein
MYGRVAPSSAAHRRLTAETGRSPSCWGPEIASSASLARPAGRRRRWKARVGGFTTFKLDKILALEPDLVLAFSDLQRDVVRDLIGAGVAVLCTNQRSFDEVLHAMLLIGCALGCARRARVLIGDMQDDLRQVREYSAAWPDRPRVYFEEWMDPLIAGIRWVSEAIELAGGRDVFAELRDQPAAPDRIVAPRPSSRETLRSFSPHGAQAGRSRQIRRDRMGRHRGGEDRPDTKSTAPISFLRVPAREWSQAHPRDNQSFHALVSFVPPSRTSRDR